MKFLIKPTTTDEYWDIPAVLLTVTPADAEALRALIEKTQAACRLTGAARCHYHDTILWGTALETLDDPKLERWAENADDYQFKVVPDTFEVAVVHTRRTDNHLSIHADGDTWLVLGNHYGSGELEVNLSPKLLKRVQASAPQPSTK